MLPRVGVEASLRRKKNVKKKKAWASRIEPLLNHSGSVQRKWELRRYQGSLAIKSCNDINRQTGRAPDKSVSERKEKRKSDFFFLQCSKYAEFNRGQRVKERQCTKKKCVCVCACVQSRYE